MASSDFGGNGLGMRNGHAKLTRAVAKDAKEKSSPPKKGRAREGDVRVDGNVSIASEKTAKKRAARGVHVERRFTSAGIDPLDDVVYERRSSTITNPDGSVVFKMDGAEIPASWSQLATDIVISKYFRKAGLHGDKDRGETSVRQVVHRIAHTIREAGEDFGGYFATKADADAFEAELSYLLVNQYGAFNSPVWFNCGLWHEYEIAGLGRELGVGRRGPARTSPRPTTRLRAPAVLGLLHPGRRRRPDVRSTTS